MNHTKPPQGQKFATGQRFKKRVNNPKPQAISENDKTLAGIHKRVMLGIATGEDAAQLLLAIDAIKRSIAEKAFGAGASLIGDQPFLSRAVRVSDIESIINNIGSAE